MLVEEIIKPGVRITDHLPRLINVRRSCDAAQIRGTRRTRIAMASSCI